MIGKPEKGRMVENLIIQMAQTRQIVSKLTEEELIGLLEKVNQQFGSKHKTTVKVIILLEKLSAIHHKFLLSKLNMYRSLIEEEQLSIRTTNFECIISRTRSENNHSSMDFHLIFYFRTKLVKKLTEH